jgi:hypothetical protein
LVIFSANVSAAVCAQIKVRRVQFISGHFAKFWITDAHARPAMGS